MREGKLAGLNLSFVRVELTNNIGLFRKKLQEEDVAKDPALVEDIKQLIRNLERDLVKVEFAIEDENLKRGNYMKTVEEGGQETY